MGPFPSSRSLRAEPRGGVGAVQGHLENRRGTGVGLQKANANQNWQAQVLCRACLLQACPFFFSVSKALLLPSFSASVWFSLLHLTSPFPSLPALSGPLSCSAVFPSIPHLSPSGPVNLCLFLPRKDLVWYMEDGGWGAQGSLE